MFRGNLNLGVQTGSGSDPFLEIRIRQNRIRPDPDTDPQYDLLRISFSLHSIIVYTVCPRSLDLFV